MYNDVSLALDYEFHYFFLSCIRRHALGAGVGGELVIILRSAYPTRKYIHVPDRDHGILDGYWIKDWECGIGVELTCLLLR